MVPVYSIYIYQNIFTYLYINFDFFITRARKNSSQSWSLTAVSLLFLRVDNSNCLSWKRKKKNRVWERRQTQFPCASCFFIIIYDLFLLFYFIFYTSVSFSEFSYLQPQLLHAAHCLLDGVLLVLMPSSTHTHIHTNSNVLFQQSCGLFCQDIGLLFCFCFSSR